MINTLEQQIYTLRPCCDDGVVEKDVADGVGGEEDGPTTERFVVHPHPTIPTQASTHTLAHPI